MPKVYLDEIQAVLGSGTCSSLATDANESKSISDSLTSYINSSKSTLKGEQWDKSRAKMETFNAALQSRMELASKLESAIQQALSLLEGYLGEDAMLDTDQLPEYQQKRQECQACIEKLNAMLTETRTVTHTDANGQQYTTQELVYDTATVQAQINLANETLKELDRIIQKIEGLEEVYNQAVSILEGAIAGLSPFQNQVTSITPSGIFTYKPAAVGSTGVPTGTTTTTTTTNEATTGSGNTSANSKTGTSTSTNTPRFSLTLQPKAGEQSTSEKTPATT